MTGPDKPRMLLVEDDDCVAQSLAFALDDHYHIERSAIGRGVIELVRAQAPDLVLLDIQLPDADGREIYSRLRAEALRVPVVLMSGSITVPAEHLDERAAFLQKPFGTEELLRLAERLR